MLAIPMRTVPGLFIGRRTLVCAEEVVCEPGSATYHCGACEGVIFTAADRMALADVVVKCGCGEFNQL
jgi:hypothetical protein